MPIPSGWTDNGSELNAPNGRKVVLGFRGHIMKAAYWDPGNQPLENETYPDHVQLHNLSLGKGSRQCFRDTILWYTDAKGVVEEKQLGFESKTLYDVVDSLQKEVSGGGVSLVSSMQGFMDSIATSVQQFSTSMSLINSQATDGPNKVSPLLLKLISDLSSAVQKFQSDTNVASPPTAAAPKSAKASTKAKSSDSNPSDDTLELPG